MEKIVLIGDSHCDLFNEELMRKRGLWSDKNLSDKFDCRWLGPVTFWKVCRDQRRAIDFENGVYYDPHPGCGTNTKLNPGQTVVLFFGEIDVRCHLYNFQPVEKTIDMMCENLKQLLLNFVGKYDIHISSILPPMASKKCISPNSSLPFLGDDDFRANATIYFNNSIKSICQELNVGYFDIYSLYCDENNLLEFDKSDGIVHGVKTIDLENYIKLYFKEKLNL